MQPNSDPVLDQYRRVALGELVVARAAVEVGIDALSLQTLGECLSRIDEMATMLRHRRTTQLLGLLHVVVQGGGFPASDPAPDSPSVGREAWSRALDAVERMVCGGHPDPRVLGEVAAAAAQRAVRC